MKICRRGLNRYQIYDCDGKVRLCGWMREEYIGNLLDNSVEEVFQSEGARRIRDRLACGDYSNCKKDACPYIATGTISEVLIDCDSYPKTPTELYLGFEQVCNYSCTCCTLHRTMQENAGRDLERNYEKIEKEIAVVLPYIKTISANGCGELFVSKHILNLLANWKPICDPGEVSVSLESNGSLFDEPHWKQIDNLGQYNLSVSISVMSFEEEVYQYLSGCSFPIERIIKNLHFIKGLREAGVINHLTIATVVQEQNFRQMPDFARRCIEEFGADYVRLRPYEPWGSESIDVAWFRDIRNPRHPLYGEYKRVFSDEIFKHPKVHDWSGGQDSEWASVSPYVKERIKSKILTRLCLSGDEVIQSICERGEQVAIYGMTEIGHVLCRYFELKKKNIIIIDKNIQNIKFDSKFKSLSPEEIERIEDKSISLIVTVLVGARSIKEDLSQVGFSDVILLEDLALGDEIRTELRDLSV